MVHVTSNTLAQVVGQSLGRNKKDIANKVNFCKCASPENLEYLIRRYQNIYYGQIIDKSYVGYTQLRLVIDINLSS